MGKVEQVAKAEQVAKVEKVVHDNVKCKHDMCWRVQHTNTARFHGFCCTRCEERFAVYPHLKAKEHGPFCTKQDYEDDGFGPAAQSF